MSPGMLRHAISRRFTIIIIIIIHCANCIGTLPFPIRTVYAPLSTQFNTFTAGQKTTRQTHGHNHVKSSPIFKIHSLQDSL